MGGYSSPLMLSDSLCINSRNSFLPSSSSFQYSMIRLRKNTSLDRDAAAFANSSSVKSRNISPLSFHNHSSFTLNSRQIDMIVWSDGLLPLSILLIAERVSPILAPNFSMLNPRDSRSDFILSFTFLPPFFALYYHYICIC